MRRRDFITLFVGEAATRPFEARSEGSQPIIGFLGASNPAGAGPWVSAFADRIDPKALSLLARFGHGATPDLCPLSGGTAEVGLWSRQVCV